MRPYYVTLTGSRNNAGDFLIRHRGHALLAAYRPDRAVVDLDGWKTFTDEDLATVNGAAALILLGGPALRKDMYPSVYPLREDLREITAPITTLGAGWHAYPGSWEDSRNYRFTDQTLALLQRCAADGLGQSVRDYRSLNALDRAGIPGGVMTGCPALYIPEQIGSPFVGLPAAGPGRVVFSPGVNFVQSPGLAQQAKDLVRRLAAHFGRERLTVAFHHSVEPGVIAAVYGDRPNPFVAKHRALVDWLNAEGIAYEDISGGVEKLLALYQAADFHVGYRVHAHICMSSLRKPSILLTEDGRGRGLKDVLGGVILDTYAFRSPGLRDKIRRKLGRGSFDRFGAFEGLVDDVIRIYEYERAHGWPRLGAVVGRVDEQHRAMKGFLQGLP